MKVLFVVEQVDYEPQGIMQLSSVLKQAGHQVEMVIARSQDPVQFVREWKPGIVGYSVLTGSQRFYLELNRTIKEALPSVFSVFGGPHPTFFPEMIEEEGVDGICIGEGEGALLDLANALEGKTFHPRIPNWHFKIDGEIIRNPVRPLISDLDSLPLPDRDLIYERDRVIRRQKIKHFIAGRGCPFNCTYCFNHAFFKIYRGKGRRVRMRSVDKVLEEIKYVQARYPLEFVVFLDDTFILDLDWLTEFAGKYPRQIRLPFFCNVRANLVSEEVVTLLKEAGCFSVSMGVETANDRLRNGLLKRGMSRDDILNASRLLRAKGIRFTTTNIIGLPTSTLQDDWETVHLNAQCRPDYAHAFIFQPYPRTELGEFTREQGLMVGTFDDLGPVAWDDSVLKFPPEHKKQLRNLQRFFAIVVEWPWLEPLIRLLIRLPSNRLFWFVHKLWKGYAIKNRVHPVRLSLAELVETVWHFMKIHS